MPLTYDTRKGLEYAENSPILKEMRKPQLMLVKNQNFGIKKLKARIAADKKQKIYR